MSGAVQSVLPGLVHPAAYGPTPAGAPDLESFQNRVDPTRRLQHSAESGLLSDPRSGQGGRVRGPQRGPLAPVDGEGVDEPATSAAETATAFMEAAAGFEETHRHQLGTYGREFVARAPAVLYRKPQSAPSTNPTRRAFYVVHPF